jgi:hypothetical protein
MNSGKDAIEVLPCTAEPAADSVELFYRQIVDLLRLSVPAAGPEAIGMLIYVGPADLSGLRRQRASIAPSTFLLWLYPPNPECSPFQERPLEGTRTLACPLAEGVFYSDRVRLLIAAIPERRVELRVAPELSVRCAKQISRIKTAICSALENHSNDATRGLIRLRCSLWNVPAICGPASQIPRTVPPGVSAIVCGAGPSLLSQMDLLRRVADRVTIIAVGHAVSALVGAGIMPHMVVEGDSMSYQNWTANLRPDALLVALAEVSPEVAARFHRVLWCHGCSMPFKVAAASWGLPLREVTLNKTVTVQAIDIAVRLGFDRIALIGQDFSISETGQLHAVGGCVNRDEQLVSLPGNEGRRVLATVDLSGLHDALENYLTEMKYSLELSGRHILMCNCTNGGAVIQGTVRMTLETFQAGFSAGARLPALHEPGPAVAPPLTHLAALSAGLGNYVVVARDIVRCCARLHRELEAAPLSMDRVRRRQDVLQDLMRREEAARADRAIGLWVVLLLAYVDEQMKKSPALVSDTIDPLVQLRLLRSRFEIAADLCSEIRQDVDRARARWVAEVRTPKERSPYLFKAFRRQGLRWIGAQNQELSHFLGRGGAGSMSDRFQVHWINQLIPYVQIKQPSNSWVPLNGFASMFEQSRADVEQFLATTNFSTDPCGVTCIVPGNWAHVLELAIRFPSVPLIVIDPWLDLLSAMIERGLFLHRLPADALIIGVHEKLSSWEDLYRRRVREWAGRGIRNILWAHPRAPSLPDVLELVERVKVLAPTSDLEEAGISLGGVL